MDISSRYFNRNQVSVEERPLNIISGNGTLILHDSSLDVDISVRVSDLLKTIKLLTNRVTVLESMVGVDLAEDEEPEPVDELIIGNIYRLRVSGTKLLLEIDINLGLSIRDWQIKQEWDL
jgi:hypothetical protein